MFRFLFALLLSCCSLGLVAQTSPCATPPTANDFDIAITKAICQGDGAIDVSTTYDLTQWINVTYKLQLPDGASVTQASPHFSSLSAHANDYVLLITGECAERDASGQPLSRFSVTKNFKLGGGTRVPHIVTWAATTLQNETASRASYIVNRNGQEVDLRLGKIALDITTSLDPDRITLRFKEAPDPALVGQRVGYTRQNKRYTLDGTYPAGYYEIYAHDGCTDVPVKFTLDALRERQWDLNLGKASGSCNRFLTYAGRPDEIFAQVSRYYYDDMFEYSLVGRGQTPTTWVRATDGWGGFSGTHVYAYLDLPYTPKDLYNGKQLIDGYVRLAGTDIILSKKEFGAWGEPAYLETYWGDKQLECGYFTTTLPTPHNRAASVCWPLHQRVTEVNTGRVVYDNPNYTEQDWQQRTGKIYFGQPYLYRTVTADGYVYEKTHTATLVTQEITQLVPRYFDGINPRITSNNYCGTFLSLKKKVTDPATGAVSYVEVCRDEMSGPTHDMSCRMEYDTDYVCDQLASDGKTILTSIPLYHKLLLPEKLNLEIYSHRGGYEASLCLDGKAVPHVVNRWQISWASEHAYTFTDKGDGTFRERINDVNLPIGTIITVESDNPGWVTEREVVTKGDEKFGSTTIKNRIMLPGTYKVTIDVGGQGKLFKTYIEEFSGGYYLASPLTLKISEQCNTLTVIPDWDLRFRGYAHQAGTLRYFKYNYTTKNWDIIYPTNYGREIASEFREGGRYKAVILGAYNEPDCIWDEKEFVFVPKRPRLTPSQTLAFTCSPGSTLTTVMIGVMGGTAPYTYELFESTGGVVEEDKVINVVRDKQENEQVVWEIPSTDEYTVRVTDGCGEISQFVFMPKPLEFIPFSLATAVDVCEDAPLEVYTYDIPGVKYEWTHPDGTKSYAPVIKIDAATPAHAGTYHLKVSGGHCSLAREGDINIKVRPRLKKVNVADAVACVDVQPLFNVTHEDGRAPFVYRWEFYDDTRKLWVRDGRQTGNKFTSNRLIGKPIGTTLEVRCTVIDACDHEVTSPIATATVRQCYVPINPQLMHPVKK